MAYPDSLHPFYYLPGTSIELYAGITFLKILNRVQSETFFSNLFIKGTSRQNFKTKEQFNLIVQTAVSGARPTGFRS